MELDYLNNAYNQLKNKIDRLIGKEISATDLEVQKGVLLAESKPYLNFLMKVTKASEEEVRDAILELSNDKEFFAMMSNGLNAISNYAKKGIETGEIRVHSYSEYAIVRLKCPSVMVETGVANGKSSAFILRAMNKNNKGYLHSVDLPGFEGDPDCKEGIPFIPKDRKVGWLVPQKLRERWDLRLGDARKLLPQLKGEINEIDIFLHDSLHTYEHMTYEFEIAKSWIKSNGLILADDIQANNAFAEQQKHTTLITFGTFGAFYL